MEIDESEEQRRVEANNLRRREEELLESGNNIRDMAVARRTSEEQEGDSGENVEEAGDVLEIGSSVSSGRKRRRW